MKPTTQQLVTRYINLVYYYTKRWVHNHEDIDDMVQETYKKALMHYNTFTYQSESQLKSWLLSICRNSIFDAHKLKKQTIPFDREMEDILPDGNAISWLETEIKREEIALLKKLLQLLSENDYDIIRMRYFDELSFKQIAKVLQMNEPKIKMRCYRAIEKMKKETDKYE